MGGSEKVPQPAYLMKIKVVAQAMTLLPISSINIEIDCVICTSKSRFKKPIFFSFITRVVWFNKALFSESKNRSA